jgi:hypothetical protein
MAKPDSDLDRLLRAAAQDPEPVLEMPFGFDTRVVALARTAGAHRGAEGWELTRLLRRVAAVSLVLTVFAGGGAYWQLSQTEQEAEPFANAYAIADTAIAGEFAP